MNAPHASDLTRPPADAPAAALVAWALDTFADRLAVAISFGAEDMVLYHLVAEAAAARALRPHLFTLDTGRLADGTWALADRAERRYGLRVAVYAPERAAVEALVAAQGPLGFRDSVDARRACCHARKVAPLGRALAGADAWLTGLRRAQSVTRVDLAPVAPDDAHGGMLKVSPLATWSERDVWDFVTAHDVPVHPLHAEGYPSIGCAPCTRAVPGWSAADPDPTLDLRAGRWWWEHPEHKECGLHLSPTARAEGASR